MKRYLLALAVLVLAAAANAQSIAVQRAQHNAMVCASVEAASSCNDTDVVLALCGFSSGPTGVPQSQIDACATARQHDRKVYSADAAFRTADDASRQVIRIAAEKETLLARLQRLMVIAYRGGGANCINLLTALGVVDTSTCSK